MFICLVLSVCLSVCQKDCMFVCVYMRVTFGKECETEGHLSSTNRYHPNLSPNNHNGYPQYHTLHQSGAYRGGDPSGGGSGGGGGSGSGSHGYYTYNPHQSQYGSNYYNGASNDWNHLPASPASPSGVRTRTALSLFFSQRFLGSGPKGPMTYTFTQAQISILHPKSQL